MNKSYSPLAVLLPALALVGMAMPASARLAPDPAQPLYRDTSLSFEERAADLVSRMTLEEKSGQLGRVATAVPRLGVARYDYWNEALHGIQNGTGEGTSFPMPVGLSVTWDERLIRRVADAIADECRGHSMSLEDGGRGRGLSYWCPTINLARHPLWGRTNEAWGEDPFVAGSLASAFVEGMMGKDKRYLKTVPTIKHYALNDHENGRGNTSSNASEADIRDYYTRVYRYVIERTNVPSLMSAYNALNTTPCSANPFLLTTLLRETFGFTGFVVSDCGAIDMLESAHRWHPEANVWQKENYALRPGKRLADYLEADGKVSKTGSIALGLMAGCDMDCGGEFYPPYSRRAHRQGLLGEEQITLNAYRNLLARFKLGEFDPFEQVPYAGDDYAFEKVVESSEHRALANLAADRSAVLLKNEEDFLPFNVKKLRRVAVVGGLADACNLGNYCGNPKEKNRISIWAGLSDYFYVHNPLTKLSLVSSFGPDGAIREEDKETISSADVVIVVCADVHDDSAEGIDRERLVLMRNQSRIARACAELNPDTLVFLQTSNVVELGDFKDKARAILWSTQNGQAQGTAFARQIFGAVNPSGKLTFTWYAKESELPGIRQYGLKEKFLPEEKDYPDGGYTYQYFKGTVDYPFGYGLSYTTFAYANAKVEKVGGGGRRSVADANDKVVVSVDVTNAGKRAGSEVVQAYVVYPKGRGLPAKQIKGFAKVDLQPGETKRATMTVDLADCCFWNGGKRVVPTGDYTIEVGASSADIKARLPLRVEGRLAETVNVVTIVPSAVSLLVGGTATSSVTVTLKDDRRLPLEDAKLVFRSTDPAVARVDAKGVVTAVAPGVATIAVKATFRGSSKIASFPVAVTPAEGAKTVAVEPVRRAVPLKPVVKNESFLVREALEEAIRIRVRGDDYDPESLAAYERELKKARAVFFNAKATDEECRAATAALESVKAGLRDYRYDVARFPDANRVWNVDGGRGIWVEWSHARDEAGGDASVDLTTHDPKRLELRFTATVTPTDYTLPFAEAIRDDSFIKLRSRDVAQKDNDPDLVVFGGSFQTNDEHNYGWNVGEYIRDWGTTEVAIPLVTLNPDGRQGLPFVDKGFRAKGPARYSRGKIDWSTIDRFFMQIQFHGEFSRRGTVSVRIADCRIVDTTLEAEREQLQAMLDEKAGPVNCDCPTKEEAHRQALARAREALASANVQAVRKARAALKAARTDVGIRTTPNTDELRRLIGERRTELSRYTPLSVSDYRALFTRAESVLSSKGVTQMDANRMVRRLKDADKVLRLTRVNPHPLATPVEGEVAIENHILEVRRELDLDLRADRDYTVNVRFDVKIEPTHPNRPYDLHWLDFVVNGYLNVYGETQDGRETPLQLAKMNCREGSPLAAYRNPGEWMTVTQEIPVAKLAGGRLTRCQFVIFNDTGAYMPDHEDGNKWNNDSGVKLTIRNLQITTDRP